MRNAKVVLGAERASLHQHTLQLLVGFAGPEPAFGTSEVSVAGACCHYNYIIFFSPKQFF